jgi:hypothetical protein
MTAMKPACVRAGASPGGGGKIMNPDRKRQEENLDRAIAIGFAKRPDDPFDLEKLLEALRRFGHGLPNRASEPCEPGEGIAQEHES